MAIHCFSQGKNTSQCSEPSKHERITGFTGIMFVLEHSGQASKMTAQSFIAPIESALLGSHYRKLL